MVFRCSEIYLEGINKDRLEIVLDILEYLQDHGNINLSIKSKLCYSDVVVRYLSQEHMERMDEGGGGGGGYLDRR